MSKHAADCKCAEWCQPRTRDLTVTYVDGSTETFADARDACTVNDSTILMVKHGERSNTMINLAHVRKWTDAPSQAAP